MAFETLAVAIIVLVIGWAIVTYVIPEPMKKVAWVILICIACLWVIMNIHGILHVHR
jgi:hypothetical protein